MFTWISNPAPLGAAACVACLILAGCGGGIRGGGPTGGGTAQTSVAVAQGAVVVAGPRGFCVDPGSSRPNEAVPFITFGNCATIARNSRAPQPGVKAVLTASVGPEGTGQTISGGTQALGPFFQSEAGRRELSRSQDPNSVTIIETQEDPGVYYLRLRDASAAEVLPDIDADQWRAYLDVNGRLVSASVLGFHDAPMEDAQRRELIQSYVRAIRDANGTAAADPIAPTLPPPQAQPTPPKPRAGGLERVGLFRRLFGAS